MKIVCQSCSAKYSIPDDKVQGKKVFKIKCKKCGEDILVRGAEAGGDADASSGHAQHEQMSEDEQTRIVQSEGTDPIWHAVVGGEQSGPFSIDKLREMMASGAIDAETFVWKDGFGDWKPLREVPELGAVAAASVGAPVSMPSSSGGGDLFGSAPAGGGAGLFGDSPKPAAKAAAARTSGKAAGGDLFASEPAGGASKPLFGASAAAEEEDVSTSASASPRVDAKAAMTGQRNENSVLFSLASLQQIAGANTGPAKVSGPGAASRNNDQSGLIDIKSMGSTMASSGKSKAVDEILTVGGGGALSSPLSAPVLAPVPTPSTAVDADRPQGTNKTVLFSVIAVAFILAAGGIAAIMLTRNNNPPQQAAPAPVPAPVPAVPVPGTLPAAGIPAAGATATGTVPAGTVPAGTAPAGTLPAAGTAPGTTVAANTETNAGTETGRRDHGGGGARSARDSRPTGGSTASANNNTSAPANNNSGGSTATASTGAGPSGSGCAARCRGNIDCLLRCSTGSAPTPAPTTNSNAPEQPGRSDVIGAMNSVRSAVQACGNGMTGTASVSVTFASSGRVTTANVGAPFAGTPAGSCIARAVRGASVPAFSRPTFQVTYPFVIR